MPVVWHHAVRQDADWEPPWAANESCAMRERTLAAGVLVPTAQSKLDKLMAGAKQHRLSDSEAAELDDLLNKVDQLNLLKARRRYTLDRLGAKASNT